MNPFRTPVRISRHVQQTKIEIEEIRLAEAETRRHDPADDSALVRVVEIVVGICPIFDDRRIWKSASLDHNTADGKAMSQVKQSAEIQVVPDILLRIIDQVRAGTRRATVRAIREARTQRRSVHILGCIGIFRTPS